MVARRSKHPIAVQRKGRSAALTIAVVAFSVLAAAIALRLGTRGEALSHRVVVAVQGCGPSCDERLARALSTYLAGLGFDAVAPAGLTSIDDARAFARAHGARFGVGVVIAVEDREALRQAHGAQVGANALAYVVDAISSEPLRPAFVLRGVEQGDDGMTALRLLSTRLTSGSFPGIASALMASDPVRVMEEEPSGLEQQAAALELKRKRRDLIARDTAIREYRLHCEHNDELLAVSATTDGARCVSRGCAEEYLVGLLPDGQTAVVHDSSDTPLFPLAPDSTARAFSTVEKLWLVPRAGERKLLAEAANFYSRPALARDGSKIAFVEQRLGRARLYTLDLQSGARSQLYAAELPKHLSSPELSPDGKRVLFYEVDGGGGRSALREIATAIADAQPLSLLPDAIDARFVQLALAPQEPPRTLIAALASTAPRKTEIDAAAQRAGAQVVDFESPDSTEGPEGPRPELVLLDPATGAVLLRKPLIDHRARGIGGSHAGMLLLTWQDRSCGFARWTPGGDVEWVATRLCPKHIAVGPGGVYAHALLSEQPPSRQLIRIDVESGGIEVLTKGSEDVQNPMPAAGGDGLAYERVLPRKYGELQHVGVCFDER
jgi:hypothetical protein